MAEVHYIVFLGIVAAVTNSAYSALSDEDRNVIKTLIAPFLSACGKELGVSEDDIIAAKKSMDVDFLPSCYYACFFKKTGVMNAEGLFVPSVAKEAHKTLFKNEEVASQFDAVVDICSSVNDIAVTDGADGCERALSLTTCMNDNKGDLQPF